MKDINEKQPKNKFQWFLTVIFIPLLFAVFVGLIVAQVAGVNVFEKAKDLSGKLPFVSSQANKTSEKSLKEYENKIIDLQAEIENKDAELTQLQTKIDNQDSEKKQLLLEQKRLEDQIDELRQMQEQNKKAFTEIVRTYDSMSPKNAAPIILNMKDEEALKILSNLKSETLAKIMEKMPADRAAKYTELLSSKTN
ncbi:MotE family protein [Heyndrickxia sp. NPDC080065]|uniref:MotE family protein n=1 Tax=Heyndrickxia sp. NPDC080065 TaxID=3390568 RepID=UPI003D043873